MGEQLELPFPFLEEAAPDTIRTTPTRMPYTVRNIHVRKRELAARRPMVVQINGTTHVDRCFCASCNLGRALENLGRAELDE